MAGKRLPVQGEPVNGAPLQVVDEDCSVCWLQHEIDFAFDEFKSGLPKDLDDGISEMWGDHGWVLDIALQCAHVSHDVRPETLEAAADAAEFIASWRRTNAGPTRPRVVAALRSRGDAA